jgi:hypothetical protein
MKLEIEQLSSEHMKQKSELLSPVDKLLKYLAHLREIQSECEHCETVKAYHQQMRTIMEQMNSSITQ